MEPSTYEAQYVFFHNKRNANIISVVDNILDSASEAGIDENWCLLDNQSTCKAFINGKYMSKIRDSPDGKYLCFHCKTGVTYTNNIGDLTGYSNPVWYNPKGVANVLSLRLAKKHLVTYKIQEGNEFSIHSPQRPIFKITKAGIFHHDMIPLLKKKKERTHRGERFTVSHSICEGKQEIVNCP